MNLAALWQTAGAVLLREQPLRDGHRARSSESETDIRAQGGGYEIAAEAVDGMDVVAVEAAARRACGAREPQAVFPGVRTYRFRAHSMFDPQLYRDKSESGS